MKPKRHSNHCMVNFCTVFSNTPHNHPMNISQKRSAASFSRWPAWSGGKTRKKMSSFVMCFISWAVAVWNSVRLWVKNQESPRLPAKFQRNLSLRKHCLLHLFKVVKKHNKILMLFVMAVKEKIWKISMNILEWEEFIHSEKMCTQSYTYIYIIYLHVMYIFRFQKSFWPAPFLSLEFSIHHLT